MSDKSRKLAYGAPCAGARLSVLVTNDYIKHIVIIALIYSILASSLNLVPLHGPLSLGHQRFTDRRLYLGLLMMRLGSRSSYRFCVQAFSPCCGVVYRQSDIPA